MGQFGISAGPGTQPTILPFSSGVSPFVALAGAGGSPSHSYVPGDVSTLAGGAFSLAAQIGINTTQVVSATIVAGGTGGTNGAQTVTGTTGQGGVLFQASVTVAGGAITSVNSITINGVYSTNPTSLTNEPVTGAGLSGAALSVVMGALTGTCQTPGIYSVVPGVTANLAESSSTGAGLGATWAVTFGPLAAGIFTSSLGNGGNTFIGGSQAAGDLAGGNFASGSENTFLGNRAGSGLVVGSFNTGVGLNTMGNGLGLPVSALAHGVVANTFVGNDAGRNFQSVGGICSFNTAVGSSSLRNIGTGGNGYDNSAFGANAGLSITQGTNNTVLGYNVASTVLTTGGGNIIVGVNGETTASATTSNVVIIGGGAKAGTKDVAVGQQALAATSQDNNSNTAVGTAAGVLITTGGSNSLFGYQTGSSLVTGGSNVFAGYQAGHAAIGTANTFIGYQAGLVANASGTSANTFVGGSAGSVCTSGTQNTAIGEATAANLITGSGNFFGGYNAGLTADGNNAVLIGGAGNGGGAGAKGAGNSVVVGAKAGNASLTGANNTVLGFNVASSVLTTGTNNVYIGTNSSIDAATSSESNTVRIGAGSTSVLTITGCGTPSTSTATFAGTVVSGFPFAMGVTLGGISLGAAGGAASHSYAPGDVSTLAGGTFSSAAKVVVIATQAISATVVSGGSGGTNGAVTVTGTTGAGTFCQFSGTISGGVLTGPLVRVLAGEYTTNPTTLTAEPVTGGGLTGATINVVIGALYGMVQTNGVYSSVPGATATLAESTSTGTGTGATWTVAFGPLAADVSFAANIFGAGLNNENVKLGANTLLTSNFGLNTAIGYSALTVLTSGGENTAVGWSSLSSLTTGGFNVGIGVSAGLTFTDGQSNTFVGNDAGKNAGPTPINSNTAIGSNSFKFVTAGNGNTVLGVGAFTNYNNSANNNNNVAIGVFSMFGTGSSTGVENIAIGCNSLFAFTTDSANIAIGDSALRNLAGSGGSNIGIGTSALNAATTCNSNTGVGHNAMILVTTGSRNTSLGSLSLAKLTTGNDNTAVGQGSMFNFVGVGPGSNGNNTAIGYNSLAGASGQTGLNNSVVGANGMANVTTGSGNAVVGNSGGNAITTGGPNSIMGNAVASVTLTTGSNNVYIGTSSSLDALSSSESNTIRIGAGSSGVIIATGCGTPTTALLSSAGMLGTNGYTVSTLPAANSNLKGARAYVTDQSGAPTFMGTLTGSGSVICPVFCNGTTWLAA